MTNIEFKQNLALALASNPEFIKHARDSYERKRVWYCVSEEVKSCVNDISSYIKSDEDQRR